MADSLVLNSGCGGGNLAVDNICEVCTIRAYQIVKHAFGPLDTATLVTACVGFPVDIKASVTVDVCIQNVSIPVTDNCASLTVDNGGTFAVQVDGAALTALQLIDNIVQAEDAIHGTGDAGVMALAVRNDVLAALAGTDGDYAPLQVNASGALYIQEGAALDVSAAAVPVTDNAGALTVDWNGTAPPIGAGVEATALRVTLATDSTGVVSVDDNSGSLTVDNAGLTELAAAIACCQVQVDIVASLPAGTNAIGKLAANSGVDIGDVDVLSIAAGANAIGDVGIEPRTSGGLCISSNIDVDESEDAVKATAGQLFSIMAFNLSCAVRYLKVYNATVATVVVGGACATTPKMTIPIPAHACSKGAGFIWSCPIGLEFDTAITIAATTGIAACDQGAPGANQVVTNIGYK